MAQSQFAPPTARRGFRFSTREITITAALGAVTIVMGLVPWIGFIPAPTPAGTDVRTVGSPIVL